MNSPQYEQTTSEFIKIINNETFSEGTFHLESTIALQQFTSKGQDVPCAVPAANSQTCKGKRKGLLKAKRKQNRQNHRVLSPANLVIVKNDTDIQNLQANNNLSASISYSSSSSKKTSRNHFKLDLSEQDQSRFSLCVSQLHDSSPESPLFHKKHSHTLGNNNANLCKSQTNFSSPGSGSCSDAFLSSESDRDSGCSSMTASSSDGGSQGSCNSYTFGELILNSGRNYTDLSNAVNQCESSPEVAETYTSRERNVELVNNNLNLQQNTNFGQKVSMTGVPSSLGFSRYVDMEATHLDRKGKTAHSKQQSNFCPTPQQPSCTFNKKKISSSKISEVEKGKLYLGSLESLNNEAFFKEHNITRVVSAMNNCHKYFSLSAETNGDSIGKPTGQGYKLPKNVLESYKNTGDELYHTVINISDKYCTNISQYFSKVNQIIQTNTQGATFIHCHSGISRSVTLCLAYMVWSDNINRKYNYSNLDQALQEISYIRPICNPNLGFMGQLAKYFVSLNESQRCNSNSSFSSSYRPSSCSSDSEVVPEANGKFSTQNSKNKTKFAQQKKNHAKDLENQFLPCRSMFSKTSVIGDYFVKEINMSDGPFLVKEW